MATLVDEIFRQDFRLVRGVPEVIRGSGNVRDALSNRFSVFPRSVPFRPDYGVNLKRYSNETITKELEHAITQEVEEQILKDPRVKNVRKIEFSFDGQGLLQITVEVVLQGNSPGFQFRVIL